MLLTNAQSLVNKVDEAEVIFKQNNIDICIINETWFHSDLPEHVLNINNYNLFSKSRHHQRGGGIAIYIKNYINAKNISDIIVPEELECLWVMV